MSYESDVKPIKSLKRIDCKTLYNLIEIIYSGGPMKKAMIIIKSKLNDTSLKSYLFWLESMDLIEIIFDHNDKQFIRLTEHGINFHSKL